MKQFLFFPACLLLLFLSCKKDSNRSTPKPTNTLSATIDGVNETFTDSLEADTVINVNDPKYTINVTGLRGSGASREGLSFSVNSDSPVTKGTYSITSQTNTGRTTFPYIVYWKGEPNAFTFGTDESGVNITSITITSINNSNVQGVFSGVLISGPFYNTSRTVTNGKFNVNITTK